jgi:hypothetical protein
MANIFQDPTKSAPKKDSQIIRVTMEQSDIAGRKDHLPKADSNSGMAISHVPSAGSKV